MNFLPYLSTLVSFAFAIAVFNRYLRRRGIHLLLWSVGLLFYGLGTFSEVILGLTFSMFALKLWYLMGAMLSAAWLGMGSVHLLLRKGNTAVIITWILAVVSAVAVFLVIRVPTTDTPYNIALPVSAQYNHIFTEDGFKKMLLAPTILLNSYGAITLIGGSLYSAFIFWRKKVLVYRIYGNLLIAAGGISVSLGGTLVRAGLVDWLYLSEFIGATLMFIGFLMATSGSSTASQ